MIKRFYMVPPGALPTEDADTPPAGEYHYIDLDSHGAAGQGHRVLVMMDGGRLPHSKWEALPHLLDAVTTMAHPLHAQHLAKLADVGVKAEHRGYELGKQLATIHRMFAP